MSEQTPEEKLAEMGNIIARSALRAEFAIAFKLEWTSTVTSFGGRHVVIVLRSGDHDHTYVLPLDEAFRLAKSVMNAAEQHALEQRQARAAGSTADQIPF
jgi:hypothetical protein